VISFDVVVLGGGPGGERAAIKVENVAGRPEYREVQRRLRTELDAWLRETADPRPTVDDDRWDRFPYYGERAKPPAVAR
jgi:hypothetical protein